jgi:ABC-type Na+ efflux pump permease subunit
VEIKMPQALSYIIKIAKYTLTDEVRQRSFIVMFAVCVTFVFLMRGCYHGNYMVNGQELDAGAIVG